MKTIYVAGSSHDLDWVSEVMDAVKAAGMEVAHDWVSVIRGRGQANPAGDTSEFALEDLNGVERCDALLLVAPCPGVYTIGAWVEVGYALARGIPVVTLADHDSGPPPESIFLSLTTTVESIPAALAALEEEFEGV